METFDAIALVVIQHFSSIFSLLQHFGQLSFGVTEGLILVIVRLKCISFQI